MADRAEAEAARWARLVGLPGIGPDGLQRIRAARVHVVGAGPVAGPALLALAQAGVGTLFLDDGEDVAPGDGATWLATAEQVGQPRVLAAMEAVRAASALTAVRFHATGTRCTAALVCGTTQGTATVAAERERTSGVLHVVALATGEGGEVLTVPNGAPCIRCASRPGAGTQPRGGAAAAIGCLGALELLLLVARAVPAGDAGRRVTLKQGLLQVSATERRPNCDCRIVY